jgi:uncharacterized protein YndB with AHSA1/START domain
MIKLEYSVKINEDIEHVWNTLTEPETYKLWVKPFSPDSQYKGEWKEGTDIIFFDPNMGGTKAKLKIVKPHEHILAEHTALVNKELEENTEGEIAEKWIGTLEEYIFTTDNDIVEVTIKVQTDEAFKPMYDEGWPEALYLLKKLCES